MTDLDSLPIKRRLQSIRPRFDLVDLVLFVNVAAEQSLTRGASDTALSLAAASVRIKNIEESLGTELFHRTKKGVTLTRAGQTFLPSAEAVLDAIRDLNDQMEDALKATSGHVRILANALAVADVVPDSLGEYLSLNPGVTVDIEEALSGDIVRMIREGTADIGIIIEEAVPDDLEIIPYRRFEWALVVGNDHPLAGHGSVTLEDMLPYEFIGRNISTSIFLILDRLARNLGQRLQVRAKLASFDGMCRMAAANVGITIVPRHAADRHACDLPISVVPIADDWALRSLVICVRKTGALPAFARDLLDHLTGLPTETSDHHLQGSIAP